MKLSWMHWTAIGAVALGVTAVVAHSGFKERDYVQATDEFLGLMGKLPPKMGKRVERRLRHLRHDEQLMGQTLCQGFKSANGLNDAEVAEQLFRGAYILLDDQGSTYQTWVQSMHHKHEKPSSHAHKETQYAIHGNVVTALFSNRSYQFADGVREVTWVQCERYPVTFSKVFWHLWSYFQYKRTGHNQGPFGTSSYTEANPLILVPRSD